MGGIYLVGAGIAVALVLVARMVSTGRPLHPPPPRPWQAQTAVPDHRCIATTTERSDDGQARQSASAHRPIRGNRLDDRPSQTATNRAPMVGHAAETGDARTAARAGRQPTPTRSPVAGLGSVPVRTGLGHGARGLQRRTATPGPSSRTTTPGPGCTGGTRTAWPGSATRRRTGACRWRLWNGVDPILKERMFGLAGPQGNHGEDVKEYWWYLDGTPTHSWNTWRYHYPQREFPYGDLVAENARRGKLEPEYELVDTGTFDENRYWVVTVDYAKDGPRDLAMRITVENAGPDEATLHVLPTLWFRNTWSWGYDDHPKPHPELDGDRIVGEPLPVRAAGAGRRRHTRAAVLRERDQRRAIVRRREQQRLSQGRHQRPRAARRLIGEPRSRGHQGRAALHGHRPGRRFHGDQGAAGRASRTRRWTWIRPGRASRRSTWRRASTPWSPPARPRRTPSIPRRSRPTSPGGGAGRPAGAGRVALGQAVLPLRRQALARR